ncbi:unnamed protein product [marine sediment metagenome]|uniref:Uncharacterized protein n=1 Tax=marine sediment metagenome TaxID=412755 RepID=X1DJT3_9ZZZZ
MGLIYQIIKRTKTHKLDTPLLTVNTALIISRSDKEHFATISRLEKVKTLTAKDKRDFRAAVSVLKRRGAAKFINEIEV